MERLEYEAHPFRSKPCAVIFGKSEDVGSVQMDTTTRGLIQSSKEPEQGGLAATGRPDHRDE